jgi:hypothetical protein
VKSLVHEETRQVAPSQQAPAGQRSHSASEKIYSSTFSVNKIRLVKSSKSDRLYIEADLTSDAHPELTAVLTVRDSFFRKQDWRETCRFMSKGKVWFLTQKMRLP